MPKYSPSPHFQWPGYVLSQSLCPSLYCISRPRTTELTLIRECDTFLLDGRWKPSIALLIAALCFLKDDLWTMLALIKSGILTKSNEWMALTCLSGLKFAVAGVNNRTLPSLQMSDRLQSPKSTNSPITWLDWFSVEIPMFPDILQLCSETRTIQTKSINNLLYRRVFLHFVVQWQRAIIRLWKLIHESLLLFK